MRLLNGRITNTRHASQEITIENLDAHADFSEDKMGSSMFIRGVFIGITRDLDELVFLRNLHAALRSIGRSHRWLMANHEQPTPHPRISSPKTIGEKAIHVVISLEAFTHQQDIVSLNENVTFVHLRLFVWPFSLQ